MLRHPILINRPIVVTPWARRCAVPPKRCWPSSRSAAAPTSPRKTATWCRRRDPPCLMRIPGARRGRFGCRTRPARGRDSTHAAAHSCCCTDRCASAPLAVADVRSRAAARGPGRGDSNLQSPACRCPTAHPPTTRRSGAARARGVVRGMVWCSPERHGAMTGIMKAQIDWIPLAVGRSARRKARPSR